METIKDFFGWIVLVLFFSGLVYVFQNDSKVRNQCEAKGGVLIEGGGPTVCIDKKSVIK